MHALAKYRNDVEYAEPFQAVLEEGARLADERHLLLDVFQRHDSIF
jgi:hypothetical protein